MTSPPVIKNNNKMVAESIFKLRKQCRIVKETSVRDPILAQAFCLEAISGLQPKEGNLKQSFNELRRESEFREVSAELGSRTSERRDLHGERAPEIFMGSS